MSWIFKHLNVLDLDASRGFQLFSLSRQAVTFIVGIILARSALSVENIGTYEIWMFLGMIISFLGLSGLLQSFLANFPKSTVSEKRHVCIAAFLLAWMATGFVSLLIYLFKIPFFSNVLGLEEISHLLLVLGFLLFHMNAILAPYIFLARSEPKSLIRYTGFYSVGNILAVLLPLIFGGSLLNLLQCLLIWAVIEHLVLVISVFKNWSFRLPGKWMKPLLYAAIPLTFYSGSGLLSQLFDVWLVNHTYSDLGVFAIFRYGARELPGALALAGAFSASMVVVYVENKSDGLSRVKEGSRRFMHFFFPVSILLLFFTTPLFEWIYDTQFRESAQIFNAYLLLMISRWVFPQTLLVGLGKNADMLWISFIELFVNVASSLILVNYLGLVGIALGTVLAFWVEKIIMVILLSRKYGIKFKDYVPQSLFVSYSLLMLISYLWTFMM
ncbi:MAG: polysaccharide biosynthesis C-terminal domain-containing protein [Saprospiraceae bacterium]|nr:polysaccharide biosynthesis C-terminal domain-containing protein [Saprospiraceae bacterium]